MIPLILARSGSKRLPNKHMKELNGKPMMDYVCLEALKVFNEVWFSCDSEDGGKINDHARELGMKVIERPLLFADDNTPAIQAIRYCAKDNPNFDMQDIMLLNTCCPLLTAQDIKNAKDLYEFNRFDSLVSVVASQDAHPSKVCTLAGGDRVSYEDLEVWQTKHDNSVKTYRRNAAIYIFKEQDIWENSTIFNSRVGVYVMPPERSIDVNTEFDFKLAEILQANK